MKVLFLTTNYPRPESPIDGIFVREHARAAAEVADVRVVHLIRAPAARSRWRTRTWAWRAAARACSRTKMPSIGSSGRG